MQSVVPASPPPHPGRALSDCPVAASSFRPCGFLWSGFYRPRQQQQARLGSSRGRKEVGWPSRPVVPCADGEAHAEAEGSRNLQWSGTQALATCLYSSLFPPSAPGPARGWTTCHWVECAGMDRLFTKPESVSPHLKNRQTKPSTL